MNSCRLALRLWLLSNLVLGIGLGIAGVCYADFSALLWVFVAIGLTGFVSLPALLVLLTLLPVLQNKYMLAAFKWQLVLLLLLLVSLSYGIIAAAIENGNVTQSLNTCLTVSSILLGCTLMAALLSYRQISSWINEGSLKPKKVATTEAKTFSHHKTITTMTTEETLHETGDNMQAEQSYFGFNKTLVKGLITAGLILAMLIPVAYITQLVEEREARHKNVVEEVSGKWASAQTITTPYLHIPYLKETVNDTGKQVLIKTSLIIPSNTLNVKADMLPEERKRSIYNVLLYKSNIHLSGNIILKVPNDIKPEYILFNEARLCLGINDLKGIEEKINTHYNGQVVDLEPVLPGNGIDKQGLSVPIVINAAMLSQSVPFDMDLHIKGSEQLHFLPLSDNSSFEVSSKWPDPSFDGSSLPKERTVTKEGFVAKWSFNTANMPLVSQLLQPNSNKENMAFGVSMIQPADQYAKTNRSVKYAILFIGLTFAMFFIIELMQQKQVHPVQYILVGLALIIFYTLLLSISEFIGFNMAYAIAAAATVLLIGMYAVSLFKSVKTSVLLSCFLGMLYGFIYILIQLEDTALLAGSIGLFVLLAVAMHFSKKINWYSNVAPLKVMAA